MKSGILWHYYLEGLLFTVRMTYKTESTRNVLQNKNKTLEDNEWKNKTEQGNEIIDRREFSRVLREDRNQSIELGSS